MTKVSSFVPLADVIAGNLGDERVLINSIGNDDVARIWSAYFEHNMPFINEKGVS